MNRYIILIVFLLTSCSHNLKKNDFNYSDDMNFYEFKIELLEYAENNPYPNIDY